MQKVGSTIAAIHFIDMKSAVVDVNYLDRSATTILAGGSGE